MGKMSSTTDEIKKACVTDEYGVATELKQISLNDVDLLPVQTQLNLIPCELRYLMQQSQFTNKGTAGSIYNGTISNITYDVDSSPIFNGNNNHSTASIVDTNLPQNVCTNTNTISIIAHIPNNGTARKANRGLLGDYNYSPGNSKGLQFAEYKAGATYTVDWEKSATLSVPSSKIPDTYCMISLVHDVSVQRLYIDAELIGTLNQTFTPLADTFKLGRAYNALDERYFMGKMRMLEISTTKAFTAQEIQNQYDEYKSLGIV